MNNTMENLKKLLQETRPTKQEEEIYRKVQKHYRLEDLFTTLFFESEDRYTEEEQTKINENINLIIEKYEDFIDYDWESALLDAINYVLEGN